MPTDSESSTDPSSPSSPDASPPAPDDAQAAEPSTPNLELFACPHCDREVDLANLVASPPSPFITCPHCGGQFSLPSDESQEDAAAADQEAKEEELSALRIRQLSRQRRALIRTRSYMLIAYFGCLAICAQLIYMTIQEYRHIRHGIDIKMIGYICFALAATIPATFFLRRSQAIAKELQKPLLEEPPQPPDLSSLQDGSQHWKNLDKMQ